MAERGRRSVTSTFASMTFSMAKLIGQHSTFNFDTLESAVQRSYSRPATHYLPGSQSPFQWPHYAYYENRLCPEYTKLPYYPHLTSSDSVALVLLQRLLIGCHILWPSPGIQPNPLAAPYQPTLQAPNPSITLPTELFIWIPCPLLPHRRPRA